MQIVPHVVAVAVGICRVLQGSLNAVVLSQWGLSGTGLLNTVVFLVILVLMIVCSRLLPAMVPTMLHLTDDSFRVWRWWMVLPGLFGAVTVFGLPLAIHLLDAETVFVTLIVCELSLSAMWDVVGLGKPLHFVRVLGLLVCTLGALVLFIPRLFPHLYWF